MYWLDNSDNENGFRVERCIGFGCTDFTQVGTVSANVTTYGEQGLQPNTYRYRVFAYNADGASAPSNIDDVTVHSAPPEAPAWLMATAVSHTQVNLAWSDNSSTATGIIIESCTGAGCTDFVVNQVLGFTDPAGFEDTMLQPLTGYRYRVRAYNAVGNSDYSDIVGVRTQSPWLAKAPMPTPRAYAVSAVPGAGYSIYVVGGDATGGSYTGLSIVETYFGGENWYASSTPMPSPRWGSAAAVVNGVIYVIGGSHQGTALATNESYHPGMNAWTTRAPMPTPRSYAAVAVVNGIVYVIGGSLNGSLATVEAYDPKWNTWTTKAPMLKSRWGAAAGVVNGIIYVAGGSQSNVAYLNTVEAYNPATNTWTTRAPIPTPRHSVAGTAWNGLLYVAGGHRSVGVGRTRIVEAYDPATNTWTTMPSLLTARWGATATVWADRLYVIGGKTSNGVTVSTVEMLRP